MFRSREEELILKKHKHQQLLKLFREVLTKVAALKTNTLQVSTSAHFQGDEFNFDITVFQLNGTNCSLSLYDFWEVKQCQKLVDAFISAIKSGDFEKVKAAKTRA